MQVGDAAPLLAAWQNFYVIIGSAAGALTGLQFVVLTLIGEAAAGRKDSISAFGSPNVVHFCAALLWPQSSLPPGRRSGRPVTRSRAAVCWASSIPSS